MWTLIDRPDRSPRDDALLIHVASAWTSQCQPSEVEKFYRLAEATGHQIGETEDREFFFAHLSKPAWYG